MGCWVRRSKAGTLTFVLYYRRRRWWESSGYPFDDSKVRAKAEALRHLIKASIAAGTFEADYADFFPNGNRIKEFPPASAATDVLTVAAWAQVFMAERKRVFRPSYVRAFKVSFECWIEPEIGHLPVAGVKRTHIEAIRQKMLAGGRSPKYARNVVTHAQALFTEAALREMVVTNPARGLKWPRRETRRIDPLPSAALVDKALAKLRERSVPVYRYVLGLADTGMRPSEGSGLEWGDIDVRGQGAITVRRSRVLGHVSATKTAFSERTLTPLSPRLLAELRAMRPAKPAPNAPVFVGRTGLPIDQQNLYARHWAPVMEEMGMKGQRLVSLRHTFISLALSAKPPANPMWLSEYTGVSLVTMRRNYARWLRPAAKAINPFPWIGCAGRRKSTNGAGKPPPHQPVTEGD